MKKPIYSALLMLLVLSCSEEQTLIQPGVLKTDIKVENGRLVFKDFEQLAASLAQIENSGSNIADGHLRDLQYSSYFNVLVSGNKLKGQEEGPLNELGFQIILNQDREVQVGHFIYTIDNEISKKFSKNGKLLETYENQIEFYNQEAKSFTSSKNARTFNEWAVASVAYPPLAPVYVGNRFYRIISFGFLQRYYYHTKLKSVNSYWDSELGNINAEYWENFGVGCDCQYPHTDNPPRYTHNVAELKLNAGSATTSYYNNTGIALFANVWVKIYNIPQTQPGAYSALP